MTDYPTVLADDPDAAWSFDVTDPDGNNLDWATPKAAVNAGAYDIDATWLGDPAPTRRIRVPLDARDERGLVAVYLQVPGGNDIQLGYVNIRART